MPSTDFLSIEEAYGPWGLKNQPFRKADKKKKIFNGVNPKVEAPKKSVDDLEGILPISTDEADDNFKPTMPELPPSKTERHPYIEPFESFSHPWTPSHQNLGGDSEVLRKLDHCMKMLENRSESVPNGNDVLMYTFTGVFLLFVFDMFANSKNNNRPRRY